VQEHLLSKRSAKIRGMFGRIAHRYDLLNRVLSLGQDILWRRIVARTVHEARAGLVLDLCTGTGDVAMSFVPGPQTIACDFCLPMLAHARHKILNQATSIPLFAGDALELPLASSGIDVITIAFGVRNFEDLDRGLKELHRVLRNDGILLILEFSQPAGPLAPVLNWWTRTIPPFVGRLISGDPEAYSYLPASVSTFPSGEAMSDRLKAAGFGEVKIRALTGGVASLYEARLSNNSNSKESS
jgi:demethylmenaquinone methyltransferase/2-methoxy-6-polyprenyl-1,4-benzoquinol methylase